MRVLHCPTMVGGNPQGLARAERLIGLDSRAVACVQNYLGYRCDEVLWTRDTPLWRQQLRAWQLLWRAGRDFDVVHYNAGTTILPWKLSSRWSARGSLRRHLFSSYVALCRASERRWLKHKVIAVTFQGDDARQGDYCRRNFDISIANELGDEYYPPVADALTRERIAKFDRDADLIYAVNPDLLWVLPQRARFVPYAHLDIQEWQPVDKETAMCPVVLHAPSHRGAKGTRYIIDAVERLRSEGIALEFILVENLANAEARRLYERADLVIDQLLAGWYGGFAVEAMALAKPVVCYLRRSDFGFLPDGMHSDLPLIDASPATIYDVLRSWLTERRGELRAKGGRSRAYVERWHDPIAIATQLKADYARAALAKGLPDNCRSGRTPARAG